MSNELAALPDKQLNEVLRNSLYPGASDMSLELVKGYCKAANLDIMLKPVHIVPMWNATAGKLVDVVMPGIGLYRTTASRTKQYAGIGEPIYGPTVIKNIGGVECTFPEWCKVTVKRNFGGIVAEFTAQEFWLENYAVKGGKDRSIAPNAMWMRRPYGQLAKCSEAQALRKAFPEVGAQPTAEEMEGKALNDEKVVNPLPSAEPLQTLSEVLAKVKAQPDDDFSWIDRKAFTREELAQTKAACAQRRQELNAVVADIKPTQPDDTNWLEMVERAESPGALEAVENSIPDDKKAEFSAIIKQQREFLAAPLPTN